MATNDSPDPYRTADSSTALIADAKCALRTDAELEAKDRPEWVRLKRDQYDDAMLYQDWVISRLLGEYKDAVRSDSSVWLYTSDHAEEVGHTRNFTGHSPDEAGQVIPFMLWTPAPFEAARKAELERRPYQTDVLDWTLLDLLKVRTRHDRPEALLLADTYRPHDRRLHDGSVYRPSGTTRLAGAPIAIESP